VIALYYSHHNFNPPIVHRDISSGNILLNLEFEAFVSDFGIARPLNPNSSHETILARTYGYVAPGFSYTMVMAEKGDAYSFGVVALETIMGMHPGELLSSLSPSSSNQDVKLKDVLDPRLSPPTDKRGCTRYCPCCNNSICMLTFQPKVPTNHGKCVSRIYFSQSNIGETFP
ncbi:mdis1-interacting receptor like kinase 2, partial [Quercus suber]